MITYKNLYDALRKEKYSEQLQQLPKKFIFQVSQYLSEKKKTAEQDENLSSDEAVKTKKQLENAKSIFDELITLRKKKILGLAFVASETGIGKKDSENMLDFEKELFDSIMESVNDAGKKLKNDLDSESVSEDMALILFSEDVEELVGFEGKPLGPFSKGEMCNLPKKIADIFVEQGKAEYVSED